MTAVMDKQALRKLIKAVEAGNLPEAVFHGSSAIRGHWAYTTGLDNDQRRMVFRSYNGSLDAAKALHEALLPGWSWALEAADVAEVWPLGRLSTSTRVFSDGAGPARAWLLAILKAVEAQP